MISPVKCLLASALTATVVNGHGWMTKPAATFGASAGDKTQFIATIDSSTTGFKGTFNGPPSDNVAAYTKAIEASTYKSLKALVDDKAKITVTGATLTCGTAEPDAAAQPLPATVEWSHSDSEGFTPSHEGPCEVWCDDTMGFHDDNCAANFKAAPAELPYEKSKCSGASKLTFYWMAMHGPTWQVYVNCATLSGGSGGGTTQSSGSAATPTTDSSFTGSPAAQTPSSGGSPSTPSSGGSPSTLTTDSSSADTPSVTPVPASGGSPSTQITPAPASGGSPSTSTTQSSNTSPSTTTAPSTSTTDESDCGSYDVAGGSADEGKDNGTPTTGGNTYQQGGNTDTQTNTGGDTNQGSNTGTNQWTNTGGNADQWSNTGGNTEQQWTNTGTQNTGTQQNTQQNTGTGSQNSYSFNTFQGNPNTGTVAPQNM
ncbi:hypothetical protein V7S43_003936 [Phytophthora oleae]|uniref:Uncharacterized protein n=1 Tax=Phytophthora oleae TaxID=2107226 RepID=A0ABD3FVI1_9STRA